MTDERTIDQTESLVKDLFDRLKNSSKEDFSTEEWTEFYEYVIQTGGARRLVGDWDTDKQLMCLDKAFKNLTNNRFCLAIYKDRKPIGSLTDRFVNYFYIHVFDTEKQKSLEFINISERDGSYTVSIPGEEDGSFSVNCTGSVSGEVFVYILGKSSDIMREVQEFTGIGEAIIGFKKNE